MNDNNADADTLELRLVRELAAAPADVFDAYTDPDSQRVWLSALGPEAGEVETSVDLRVGGVWEAKFRPNPDVTVHDVQTYLEVDRPRRLVTRLVAESTMNGRPMPTLTSDIVVEFAPSDMGTTVTVHQSGFPSAQVRDFFATVAWQGGFDRLEAHLAGRSRPVEAGARSAG